MSLSWSTRTSSQSRTAQKELNRTSEASRPGRRGVLPGSLSLHHQREALGVAD